MPRNYYIGNLQRGLRQGHGCDFISNSSVFLGSFKNDKRHGYGKLTQLNQNETLPIEIDWGLGTIHGLNQITEDFSKLQLDNESPKLSSFKAAASEAWESVMEVNSESENNESEEEDSSVNEHQNQMQQIDHTT